MTTCTVCAYGAQTEGKPCKLCGEEWTEAKAAEIRREFDAMWQAHGRRDERIGS